MHVCVCELTIIGSDNGLSPGQRQAIIWTNAGILSILTSIPGLHTRILQSAHSPHVLLMNVVATPVFPQRPVRPIRCTKRWRWNINNNISLVSTIAAVAENPFLCFNLLVQAMKRQFLLQCIFQIKIISETQVWNNANLYMNIDIYRYSLRNKSMA